MGKIYARRLWMFLIPILLQAVPIPAYAQSQAAAATLEGYVYDPTGAVVPDAGVTARNAGTGLTRSVKTGNDGHFLIVALSPGTYAVTIAKAGFAELKIDHVLLRVGDAITLEGHLKPAQIQEETVVIADANPNIETTRTQPGTVIERNVIDALPLNGRNWTELVLLTPGVTNSGEFGNVTFGGVDAVFNNIQVDGADNNNAFFGEIRGRTRAPFQFSQETVQEFRVANNNFSAEFGRAAGGIVNAITRSGSNSWRGSAFYYLRDDFFNANNFFNNANGIPRPPERRQQFGGNIGGPLAKDKLFLFFNYDQQVRNEPLSIIRGARLDRDISLLAPTQRAQAEALLRPFVRSVPRDFNQINFFPRIDWNLHTNHNLTVTHNFQRFSSFNGLETRPTTTSNDTGNGQNFTNSYSTVFTLNSVFTPTLVNEFRYNLVFDDAGDRGHAPQLPRISFSGFDLGGNTLLQNLKGDFPGRFTFERRHQFVDNISFLRSKHTIKLGFDLNRVQDRNLFAQNINGTYSFGDVTNFLQQNLSSYSQRIFVGSPIVKQVTLQHGYYAQDTYRVTSRVTLYYGLRYELQTLPKPLIPNPLEPLTARFNVDRNNFEPRFGFAISATRDNKTVIRGGFGIFHGLTPNLLINDFITRNNAYAFDIFLSGDALVANGIAFPPVEQLNLLNLAKVTFPRLNEPPGGVNFANPTGDITVGAPIS